MFRRGHMYWIKMPGEGKLRPALVLSPDRRNDRAETMLVVPCSSVKRLGPWHVALRKGEAGLPRDSVVKCEDITLLAKTRAEPKPLGGPLSAERLDEIRSGILRSLDFE